MGLMATVAGITVICFLIGMAVKVSPLDDRYIPVIVGLCGGILGIFGLKVIPEFPVSNIIDAIAVGIESGFASTGIHQLGHQLSKDE